MKPLLGSLLLASLCDLSSWCASSETLVVTQSHDVSVMEGHTLEITCCWTGEAESMTVNWLKNQTSIKSERILEDHSQASLRKETSDCSNLIFTNITREGSGRYTCRVTVEIPLLNVCEGNGTVITVTAREKTNDNTKDITTEETRGEQKDGTVITVTSREKTKDNTKDNTMDNTDPSIAGGPDWEEVLIYVLRCLPILALVMSFLYLNRLAAKAQQQTPAARRGKAPSAQRIDENKEEEEREEREAE